MNDDRLKKAAPFLLIGLALLLFAGPMGDWVGRMFQRPSEKEPTPHPRPSKSSSTSLPVLHLKKEVLKPAPNEMEEPQLPVAKSPIHTTRPRTLTNDEIESNIN